MYPEDVSGSFEATIEVEDVENLNAGQFDLIFDPTTVNVIDVIDGEIAGVTIPIDMWGLMSEDTVRVLFKLPDVETASGSGCLAKILFEVKGKNVDTGEFAISEGLLVDVEAEKIGSEWTDAAVDTTSMMPLSRSEDFTLSIYGNANEDYTINMIDVTKIARIICWLDPPTLFADANYDGVINVENITQTQLIILERENVLTVMDAIERNVTIEQPTERVITLYPATTEMVYAFELNNLVGVDDQSHECERFEDLTPVGDGYVPDYSAIADLNPDLVITVMRDGCVPPSEIVSNLYDLGCYASVICIATDS